MREWRCTCGKARSWGSDPPPVCMGCDDCGSNLLDGLDPQPHKWIPHEVETDEGTKILSRCAWCYCTKKEIERIEKRTPSH